MCLVMSLRNELHKFNDTMQKHLRALSRWGMKHLDISSLLELKLEGNTTFEKRKHSQSSTGISHFQDLLDFVDLGAQA